MLFLIHGLAENQAPTAGGPQAKPRTCVYGGNYYKAYYQNTVVSGGIGSIPPPGIYKIQNYIDEVQGVIKTMATTFYGYNDAFAVTPGNATAGESNVRKLSRKCRKLKNKIKDLKNENENLKQTIIEIREAEEKRLAEASFFSKVKNAAIKAIPIIMRTVISHFVKCFFSRRRELKYA